MTALLIDHDEVIEKKEIATFVELHQLNEKAKHATDGNMHWTVRSPDLNYARLMQSYHQFHNRQPNT